jgi:hypothetical protein
VPRNLDYPSFGFAQGRLWATRRERILLRVNA